MAQADNSFEQRSTKLLVLFLVIIFLITIFLTSVLRTIISYRGLPASTSVVHDRALRGAIISGDGYTLSQSKKTYTASLFVQSIVPEKQDLIIQLFSIYSGIDKKIIRDTIETGRGYTVLAKNLDANRAIHLKRLAYRLRREGVFRSVKNSRGVDILYGLDIIESGEVRRYPLKDTLSPVLGYVRKKSDGKYREVRGMKGLERYCEKYLNSNRDGFIRGKRDVAGMVVRNNKSIRKTRTDGLNVHLNVQLPLQRSVELILDSMKRSTRAKEIIAGIMVSSSGKVLALASSNRYSPSSIKPNEIDRLNPKCNEFLYEPGSVMKPITLAIALEHKKINANSWIDTNGGKLKFSDRYTITDHEDYGTVTATDVIVHSSNVGISKIAWKLSGRQLHNGLIDFGFADTSGLDLTRNLNGKIKEAQLLNEKLHRANQAYGYGMTASFAQVWKAYSSFDNNGIAVTPRIIDYLQDAHGKQYRIKPEADNLLAISHSTAATMRNILIKTVQEGTGRAAKYPGLSVGGKTGTAHIVDKGKYINKYNSSFFGFAGDSNGSRYTIGVLAIKLTKGHRHFASQSAVPTFRKIIDSMVELDYLKPNLTDADQIKKAEMIQGAQRERKQRENAEEKQRETVKQLQAEREEKRGAVSSKTTDSRQKERSKYSKKVYHPEPHDAVSDLF